MTSRNLNFLLAPRSVAVIGATGRAHSIGATVLKNILAGEFQGPVWPVNPKHATIGGRKAYISVADLPEAPDLAVICTPAATVPALIRQLGEKGTRAAIVISACLESCDSSGQSLQSAMLEAARPYLLRILGPNCLGLLSPRIGLNASFAHVGATAGSLAFVSQSGALTTAMLDWACARQIGFSHFISLGNSADVDFGDLLDYLCADAGTRAILLYIESITGARKFMSAARAAARNKPVIVVKAGRAPEGAKAASSHTGALAGADDVYEAAIRRAGMLRVRTTRELFEAAETLARVKSLSGERLLILSNGGGPAVMATDALIEGKGVLAPLSSALESRLEGMLPGNWSRGNPIDIIGDSNAKRYAAALQSVLEDEGADAVLLIHAPTAVVTADEIATECAPLFKASAHTILTCWMGQGSASLATDICRESNVPTFATPEEGVEAFLQLVRYRQNQRLLMEVPSSLPEEFKPRVEEARAIVEAVLVSGRSVLMEHEAKGVLAAYDIPIVPSRLVQNLADLESAGKAIGFPVALKIVSPDISHKSDVGGVVLDIADTQELRVQGEAMRLRCKDLGHVVGLSVQSMAKRESAVELIAGMTVDATFGPVLLFGHGGTAVEVIADKAVALPPLNMSLARDLVARTRISKLLSGYRSTSAVDERALCLTLVKISQLTVDFPELVELDINPLLANAAGVLALDARMRVERPRTGGASRLAIRPYPQELEERVVLGGRPLLLRPIRPEDFEQHRAFLSQVSPEDLRTRFFHYLHEVSLPELASLTQIDYERAMAFIAVADRADASCETLGVVRAYMDPDNIEGELAILVRSDWGGRGLGAALLVKLVRYARARGLRRLFGDVLPENVRMLHLARDCGFTIDLTGGGVARISLNLS